MQMVEIIPHGRDSKAKQAYMFFGWYFKISKRELEKELHATVLSIMIGDNDDKTRTSHNGKCGSKEKQDDGGEQEVSR